MAKHSSFYPVLIFAGACTLLASRPAMAAPQSQGDSAPSVAEAARRAREKKKENAKPVRTLTNDDLPPQRPGDLAAATASPAPEGKGDEAAAPAAGESSGQKQAAVAHEQQTKSQKDDNAAALERAKKQLAQLQGELDIMQRKAVLDSDSYYSKTDFSSDAAGKANLDAEAQQINAKKQDVVELQARVAELQALVGDSADDSSEKSEKSDQDAAKPPTR